MYQMNNKNLFRITCTQVSYYILTCVRVFLWKERIHSHSFDCIKNFIQHVFVGFLNKKCIFRPKTPLFMYKNPLLCIV